MLMLKSQLHIGGCSLWIEPMSVGGSVPDPLDNVRGWKRENDPKYIQSLFPTAGAAALMAQVPAPADVAQLLSGESADLVFTDPPHNVAYEGYTEDRLQIQGDRMSREHYEQPAGKGTLFCGRAPAD